ARKVLVADRPLAVGEETEMTFVGFVTFRDPPKACIKHTLRELAALGISLRMLTGDNRLAAAHTATAVGLDASHVLTGSDLNATTEEHLAERITDFAVVCQVEPGQ